MSQSAIVGVQVVVEEDNGDAPVLESLDVFQSLQGVSAKTRDLAGNQEIVAAGGAGSHQIEKVLPLFGGQTALAVIDEGFHKGPVGVPVHVFPEVVGHVVQGSRLGFLLRADPGVCGTAQGNIFNVTGLFDQVPQFIDGQIRSLRFDGMSFLPV